jgi:hypothetical protein
MAIKKTGKTKERPDNGERNTTTVNISKPAFALLTRMVDDHELKSYVVVSRAIEWLDRIGADARKVILAKLNTRTEAQILRLLADGLDPLPTGMGRVPADVANNDPTPQPSPNSTPESA